MPFNSLVFFVFFALVLLVHRLPVPWRIRKFNLLAASYLFYMAWNPAFVVLLWFSTLIDWLAAGWIGRTSDRLTRRLLLVLSLSINLGTLAFFKYAEPARDLFAELLGLLAIDYQPAESFWDIVLPLGISFYTFQSLSYTIDVYRRRIAPWPSLLDFALYVAFFPQLVAGPIVRADQFLPQCAAPRRASRDQFGWGMSLIVLGLFLKIVLADGCFAPVVNKIYQPGLVLNATDAWVGALGFVGQLYCDFSGYSSCAVGLALCLGFVLPANFRFPLAARSFSDFWSRFHITLSRWLHDYLFQPLGGYRRKPSSVAFNLAATMFACGVWHGLTLNFLLFGLLNGLYLIIQFHLRRTDLARLEFWRTGPGQAALWALCFGTLTFTLVLFRAADCTQAASTFASMCGLGGWGSASHLRDIDVWFVLIPLESIVIMHWLLHDRTLEGVVSACPFWLWIVCLTLMASAIILVPGQPIEYVYFQF